MTRGIGRLTLVSPHTEMKHRHLQRTLAAAIREKPVRQLYSVRELFDFGNVRSLLDERKESGAGPLDMYTTTSVLAQAAAGLAHLHKLGVSHGDVKAANLLHEVQNSGTIRVAVADFSGAQKQQMEQEELMENEKEEEGDGGDDSDDEESAKLPLKERAFPWRAPELVCGNVVRVGSATADTDVYSFGFLMCE